ncbi:MAG: M24 family metallopeptidase [Luteolibacter sp.]|jgi:Xaa-Pro aminopeptidase
MAIRKPSNARKSAGKGPSNLLLHASSDDPDMLYFSRFHASDPYLAFRINGRRIGVGIPMEFARMKNESTYDDVLLLPELREGASRQFKLTNGVQPTDAEIVQYVAKLYGIKEFQIGHRFPAGLALELQAAGFKLDVAPPGGLLPERAIKTKDEIAALRMGNKASAAGHYAVAKTLEGATIRNGYVIHQGSKLTSERLREIIFSAVIQHGAVAADTIAAAGDQACNCHEAGTGPIRANELIVVDIFPRRLHDGYWGDMTRTFLKGKASDAQRHLVRTVKRGHELGIKACKPGATGGSVQKVVDDFFAKEGYKTIRNSREPEGFFHAIGHAIGLEVHEEPVLRANAKPKLKEGMVVTIEPGLYYRGLGGCRIEDVVHIIKGGCEKISSAPYKWEIA